MRDIRQMERPRQTAARFGVSETTIWRWRKHPDFPKPFRLGANSIAFDVAELEAWLAGRRAVADATERADSEEITGR